MIIIDRQRRQLIKTKLRVIFKWESKIYLSLLNAFESVGETVASAKRNMYDVVRWLNECDRILWRLNFADSSTEENRIIFQQSNQWQCR